MGIHSFIKVRVNQAVLGLGSGKGLGLRDWNSYSPHQALNPKPSPNPRGPRTQIIGY